LPHRMTMLIATTLARSTGNCAALYRCRAVSWTPVQPNARRHEIVIRGRFPCPNGKVDRKTQPQDNQECKRSLGHVRLPFPAVNPQDAQYQSSPQCRIVACGHDRTNGEPTCGHRRAGPSGMARRRSHPDLPLAASAHFPKFMLHREPPTFTNFGKSWATHKPIDSCTALSI